MQASRTEIGGLFVVVAFLAFAGSSPAQISPGATCQCCCDVFYGLRPSSDCSACDLNMDGQVTVNEIFAEGCAPACGIGATPTPTPAPALDCGCCCNAFFNGMLSSECSACDLNMDGQVTVNEIFAVGCAAACGLGPTPTPAPANCGCCCSAFLTGTLSRDCAACDLNADGRVSINEIFAEGCAPACGIGATPTPTPAPALDCGCCCSAFLGGTSSGNCSACDLNADGQVSINEIVAEGCAPACGVGSTPTPAPADCGCCCDAFLNGTSPSECPACDRNMDGEVGIDEIFAEGCAPACGIAPTPTPTPAPALDCGCCCNAFFNGMSSSECSACDLDMNGQVTVNEIVAEGCASACGIEATPTPAPKPDCSCCCDVFSGTRPLSDCPACDRNNDGQVRVQDLVSAGCWVHSGPEIRGLVCVPPRGQNGKEQPSAPGRLTHPRGGE